MTRRTAAAPARGLAIEPRPGSRDDGRAIIEVMFLAVLLLIPTVYILVAVIRLQATSLAVAQAARDVGRLIETSPGPPTLGDATVVAETALDDQHVAAEHTRIVTTAPGGTCTDATGATFGRAPGATYDVCIIAIVELPGVPTVMAGSRNTVTGVYTVHFGALREG